MVKMDEKDMVRANLELRFEDSRGWNRPKLTWEQVAWTDMAA